MMTEMQVMALLRRYRIPFDEWGTGESKTLAHLLKDTQSGEAWLVAESGMLVWEARAAGVVIRCQGKFLSEDRQVFSDGRERHRDSVCGASVVDKLRPAETVWACAGRAIKEELGLDVSLHSLVKGPKFKRGPMASRSYPGLWSQYEIQLYRWDMDEAQFRSEGYIEKQSDKSTYFVWH
jgi:hypothetical protein